LLKLDFYLSLFFVLAYKINSLAQVGAQVSHQERAALPSPAFLFYVLCLYVCVCLISHSLPLLVRFTQHTHVGHRHSTKRFYLPQNVCTNKAEKNPDHAEETAYTKPCGEKVQVFGVQSPRRKGRGTSQGWQRWQEPAGARVTEQGVFILKHPRIQSRGGPRSGLCFDKITLLVRKELKRPKGWEQSSRENISSVQCWNEGQLVPPKWQWVRETRTKLRNM
jgi:hypothetical protein